MDKKVKVKLTGVDGNVFNLMGIVNREMKRAGYSKEAMELMSKCSKAESYEDVLVLFMTHPLLDVS